MSFVLWPIRHIVRLSEYRWLLYDLLHVKPTINLLRHVTQLYYHPISKITFRKNFYYFAPILLKQQQQTFWQQS